MGLLVAFIIPVACAHISSEQLSALPVYNQLRILCAGVWHNIVLATLAAGTLILTTWLWAPLYSVGRGVTVKTITPVSFTIIHCLCIIINDQVETISEVLINDFFDQNSPLLGQNGLVFKDTIYRVNDCTVNDGDDWYHCILAAVRQPTPGYCITQQLIQVVL